MGIRAFFGRSLIVRVGTGLAIMLILAVLNVGGALVLVQQQRYDTHVINIAGRQRMLSQRMTKYALSVAVGDEAARQGLSETAILHDRSLKGLRDGDAEMGLPAASPAAKQQLDEIAELWETFYSQVKVVEQEAPDSARFQEAIAFIRDNNELLLQENDQAVTLFEGEASRRVDTLLTFLYIIVGLDVVVFAGALAITNRAIRPIIAMTDTATQIAAGNLEQTVEVTSRDETGLLADAFNRMTARLRGLIGDLEQRAHDLEQRSAYLEASADVGRVASSILDADMLVQRVVELIRERLDLYYVGLFLVDEGNEWAVLRAGTGAPGRRMLARGHRLRVGEGMIGWCVANEEARIALDVGEDAVRFDNPDLPETRSEGALPLRSRGRVIGALTVQSSEGAAFNQDTIVVLQTMADQVAVALDNARLFQEAQEALEAERRAYGEISREAWVKMIRARPDLGYLADGTGVMPVGSDVSAEESPVAQGQVLSMPIRVRDSTIGTIEALKIDGMGEWTEEEVAMVGALMPQLGQILDRVQLYQAAQRRELYERMTGEITARLRETLDVDTVLQTAVREMRQALGLHHVTVRLGEAGRPAEGDGPGNGS